MPSSPSMVNTGTVLKLTVPTPFHECFRALFPTAKWDRHGGVFVVKSASPNAERWTRFLEVVTPTLQALEQADEDELSAKQLEEAEAAAAKALRNAEKSLAASTARSFEANRRLLDLKARHHALRPHVEAIDQQLRITEEEANRVGAICQRACAPAIQACHAGGLKQALEDLKNAWERPDPSTLRVAAQERIRSVRADLRRIGFRHRWIDALAFVTLTSPFYAENLVRRLEEDFDSDFELVEMSGEATRSPHRDS